MTEEELLAAIDSGTLKESVGEELEKIEAEMAQSRFLNEVTTKLQSLADREIIVSFPSN